MDQPGALGDVETRNGTWAKNIRIGSLELPIPSWCVPAFGIIVIIYAGFTLLSEPVQTVYSRYLLGKAEEQDQYEAYLHTNETPVTVLNAAALGGTLDAKLYASDGCVSVSWRGGAATTAPHPHFIRKITKEEAGAPAPGRVELSVPNAAGEPVRASLEGVLGLSMISTLVDRYAHAPGDGLPAQPVGQSNCLNPHPAPFNSSYGSRNGCWVQVWRNFQDGCVHYQWFNSCSNFWDVNPDGSPRVYWTQCRH